MSFGRNEFAYGGYGCGPVNAPGYGVGPGNGAVAGASTGSGFTLIVVLFILLIIVGATWC